MALSSAEAELHAMVADSAETVGIVSLLGDMGADAIGKVYADSSAALGIVQRQGMDKVRHIHTQALWVQEVRATVGFLRRRCGEVATSRTSSPSTSPPPCSGST